MKTSNKVIEHLFLTEVPMKNKMVRIFASTIDKIKLAKVTASIQEDYQTAANYHKYFMYAEMEGDIFGNPKNISARQLKSIFR